MFTEERGYGHLHVDIGDAAPFGCKNGPYLGRRGARDDGIPQDAASMDQSANSGAIVASAPLRGLLT